MELENTTTIGRTEIPAGSFVWHSQENQWKGVILSQEIDTGNRNVPSGALLVFDSNDRLRVLQSFPITTQNTKLDYIFFDDSGTEIVKPNFPPPVPPERQLNIGGPNSNSPLVETAEEILQEASSVSIDVIPFLDQVNIRAGVLARDLTLEGFEVNQGTFLEIIDLGNGDFRVSLILLDKGRIGSMPIPEGTCIEALFITNGRSGEIASRSPVSFEYQGATIAPAGLVFWGEQLTPESYLISEEFHLGETIFPPFTHLANFFTSEMIIRPPNLLLVKGVPIDSTAFNFFRGDELAETHLAQDFQFGNSNVLPAGTFAQFQSSRLVLAQLLQPTPVDGLSIQGLTAFHDDGSIKFTVLAAPATIQEIDCAKGTVSIHASGQLESGILSRPQVIAGIKLKPGEFQVSERGNLVKGILDQEIQIGGATLPVGTVLNEVVRDGAIISLIDSEGLNLLERDLSSEIDRLIPPALLHLQSKAGVFGEFGEDDITLQFSTSMRESHAIDFQRKYEITDFLDNPPFDDCDCTLEFTTQLSWRVDIIKREIVAFVSLKPNSKIILDSGFCPVVNVALHFLSFINLFEPIPLLQREIARKKFEQTVLGKLKELVELLTLRENILASSLELEDLFIEQNELRLKCSFLRELV